MSDARRRANKKWNDENMTIRYDRISVLVPSGQKQKIEIHAKEKGTSVNGLINSLLRVDMGLSDEEWKQREPEE